MSDMSPVEVKAGGKSATDPKMIIVLAVLGLVLVVLAVIQLPKLLGGGSDSAPAASSTPAASGSAGAGTAVTPGPVTPPPAAVTPPPERPRRSPFDLPR